MNCISQIDFAMLTLKANILADPFFWNLDTV